MSIKNEVVKGIVVAMCLSNVVCSYAEDIPTTNRRIINKFYPPTKITNSYKTDIYKSDVYELSNGASVVINDKEGIYELFVEELMDWSVECDSREELFEYIKAYNRHKNDYKNYDNENITIEEGCCEIKLSNGITIVSSEDIDTKDIYLPIFSGEIPYKTNSLEDTEKVIRTYLEGIGE